MKTPVLANQKGGVGKSAIATLLTHFCAQQGRPVLPVDLDHQGNFGKTLRRSGRPVECLLVSGTEFGGAVGELFADDASDEGDHLYIQIVGPGSFGA